MEVGLLGVRGQGVQCPVAQGENTPPFFATPIETDNITFFSLCFSGGFCHGKSDGNYANPNNCYGYIACSGGVTYYMPCPAGLKYDEKEDQCNYNAPCH